MKTNKSGNSGGRLEVAVSEKLLSNQTLPSRKRALTAGIALLISALPVMVMPSLASAAPTRAAQKDVGGFPLWYQDNNGVRVELCYDPNDANCVAPVSATYNPGLPLAFPGNYPDELFYSAADSDLVIVDDSASCPSFNRTAAAAGAGSRIHMALEASFLNGTLTPGDQMVFGRLRVVSRAGNGLCPANWYTFRTPYGPITLQTDQNAEIQGAVASAATNDVGCLPGPVSPCNYNLALGAPVMGVGLLHQVTRAAPGYLGSGLGLDTVTIAGGLNEFNQFDIVKWPANVTPESSGVGVDCHDAACTVIGSTDKFSVAAKLAGPIGAVNLVDFGGQVTGSTSAAKSIILTNLGSGPLGKDPSIISDISISGANAADFAQVNDCPATAIARDAGCNVAITYSPSSALASTASLDVTVQGSPVVKHIALHGTHISAGQLPLASYTTPSGDVNNVSFGAVRITTAGALQKVSVKNVGAAPLSVLPSLSVSPAFSIAYDNCSSAYVPVGGTCDIGLNFIPTAVGPVTARLNVNTNTASATHTILLSGNGTGGIAAVSPTNSTINSFPDWYQDETGLRVGQCDDPNNTMCISAPVTGGVTFPTNYPDEWFYYHAQSTPMAVSDCGLNPGTIFVEAGMEAAFLGPIAADQGITFGRLRIVSRGGGLCPNTSYQLTHPYGQVIIATDDRGNIKPAAGTTDVGCLGAPCDYTIALSAPVFEGFLTQTVRPAGYLGDPLNPSTVTGAPFIDPATGEAANYFKVERQDQAGTNQQPLAFTTEFGVSGHLVGPMIVSPASEEFGGVEVGLASAAVTKTFIFSNDGPFNVTLAATNLLTVDGIHATDFTITGTTCAAGQVLAHAQSCTVNVKFLPRNTGDRTASLKIQHDGGNSPLAAALHGIGNSPLGTAAISASVSAVKFTDLHVGTLSESAIITLSNVGGTAALAVGNVSITAGQPFAINGTTCTGFVQPNEVCELSLQFHPTTVDSFSGTLTIPSNAGSLSLPVTGKSTDVVAAQSAGNINAGLPSWYQDGNGVRVEPCLAQDGNCVLLSDISFDPTLPVAWPSNFPGESFYSLVDSEQINVPADASCGAVGGFGLLRVGTEAAFPNLPPQLGNQTIFNRIRIVAAGLCPNTSYNFIHPYGTAQLTTDANGDIRPKDGTTDLANVTGTRPMTPGLLQWDPNVAPVAPVGYLGDARTLHTVVGSQYRPTAGAEPANYFKIVRAGDGKLAGETKLFTVSGRLAGPVLSNLEGKDFGSVEMGKNSTIQAFQISNIGGTPVSAITATLGGTNASLFAITANTCAATTLAADTNCIIRVRFNPTVAAGVGAKTATLTVAHNGLRSPVTIALKGAAIAAQTPALTVTPVTLAFGSVVNGTTSTQQIVTIRNSGTGALKLDTLAVAGTNPTQYSISGTTCSNGPAAVALAAGNSCTMTVVFKPTASGAKPATITVRATDAVTLDGHTAVTITPVNVALTGTGAQGTITLSASTLAVSGRAGTISTVRLTLTNSGGAPFSLVTPAGNTSPFTFTAVAGATNNPVPKFSARSTACTNAAAGSRTCTVTVSFAPAAGTARGVYSVNMAIASNASNNPVSVRVNGTVR